MKETVIKAYSDTMEKLVRQIARFSDKQLNEVPFEGSWTPAQVADHIYRSQAGISALLDGKAAATERDPEEKREQLAKIFLDFSIKMESPEFVIPTSDPLQKSALIKDIENKSREITAALQSHDLTQSFLDFEVPGFGEFTGLEWGWFLTYHAQRHTQQLENIYKKIA
jgi:hypothetical protein